LAFRRGFKTEAERLALELRSELDIDIVDPFDPVHLAKHLRIPVLSFSDVQGADPQAVRHLTSGPGRTAVSAVTIYVDKYRRVILYNEAHASTRLVSTLGHELSHVVLEHEPEGAPVDGRRDWDSRQEEEATWLAGCLLIPRDAALGAARQGLTDAAVSARFGTSLALAKMRMNGTGARQQVDNEISARRRSWRH